VRHGVTGLTLPSAAPPGEYGAAMLQIFRDRRRYCAMALAARRDFGDRLNWNRFGVRCVEILRRAVEANSRTASG
jgi:hypothetical protein